LIAGEEVKLTGFDNFILNDKKERPGRNPKTGTIRQFGTPIIEAHQ
jgi:integration host factor subunit alpha